MNTGKLDDNIRDKFVMGLRNECLLQQLLSQDHKKPLDDLLELTRTFEAAKRAHSKQPNVSRSSVPVTVIGKAQNQTTEQACTQDFWWGVQKKWTLLNDLCYKYGMQSMPVSRGLGAYPSEDFFFIRCLKIEFGDNNC